LQPFPTLANITQNYLALSDFYFNPVAKARGKLVLPTSVAGMNSDGNTHRIVSGLLRPAIPMQPGETQLFSFANVGPDIFYNITFDVPEPNFQIIARDGARQNQLTNATYYLLGPSSRVEFLWTAPDTPPSKSSIEILTLAMTTGPDGDNYPRVILGSILLTGPKVIKPVALPPPNAFPQLPDLRKLKITKTRTFTFRDVCF